MSRRVKLFPLEKKKTIGIPNQQLEPFLNPLGSVWFLESFGGNDNENGNGDENVPMFG